MARRTGSRRSFFPSPHASGSGMKARLLEAAGGKPGPAGRPGHASFSGPSSRTKAGDAAGAGAFVSGALGAALLAAALLLAPGEARAQTNSCGTPDANGALSCADQAWANGILHTMGASAAALSLTVGGGPATRITAPSDNTTGITLSAAAGATGNLTLTVGSAGAVVIMDGGSSVTTAQGISLQQRGSGTTSGNIRSGVTIGSESNPIPTGISGHARGAGGFSLTSAATIHAMDTGLILWRPAESSTTSPAATTLENRGAITTSGDGIRVEYATPSAATQTGLLTITNSGTITVTGDGQGIKLSPVPGTAPVGFNPYGDLMLTNSGVITASATDGDGIDVAFAEGNTASSGNIDITNRGTITANRYGIHVVNHGRGDLELTNTGNMGKIESATFHAIFAHAMQDGDVTVRATGGEIASASAEGIHVRSDGTGKVRISSASDVSARTGILAEVSRESAAGETRAAEDQPLIGVTWTGTFARDPAKTAENDESRFAAIALDVTGVEQHRGAVAEGLTRYGQAAGIEARVMDLDAVLATVAEGDDPGMLPSVLAQRALLDALILGENVPTDGPRAALIVSQFREMLEDENFVRRLPADDDVDADDDGEYSDEEIKTYLTADNNDRRTFLQRLLQRGLSEGEKAVLRALTMGGDLEAALRALPPAAPGVGVDYYLDAWKDKVQELLDNFNVGDIRIAVNGGSIVSRGDGIRAYYVTPHANNGRIDITVAEGASVTGGMAGIYVANAGGDVTVSNNGTVTADEVTVAEGATMTADTAGIWVANAGGDVTVSNNGTVTADEVTVAEGASVTGDRAGIWVVKPRTQGDVTITTTGGSITADAGDGIHAYYVTPHDDNGGISVTVDEGASVTGAKDGIYVANAGEGLMLARKYTYGYAMGDTADELVAVTHGEGADAVPLLNQLVTVAGTVTGGTGAAVHLNGGAVIVEEGGSVRAGSSGEAILVNDPGPALVHIDGEVRGGQGGDAAVRLTGGGSVIVGLNGRVKADGAERTIRGGGGDDETMVTVTLVTDHVIMYRDDADKAHARMVGVYHPRSIEGQEVRFREDRDGVPTGYSRTLDIDGEGRLVNNLPPRPPPPCPDDQTRGADGECPPGGGNGSGGDGDGFEDDGDEDGNGRKDPMAPSAPPFSCAGAIDGRCQLYEALPSMLLAMNAQPSWAERRSAARDGNGGWARVEAAGGDWQAKKAKTATPLAYGHRSSAVRAGVDFHAGESARVGVSAHALGGKAEMSDVGEVELDGMGGGLSATWLAGDLYVDAQAAVTLYDVDVESYTHGKMSKKDVYGAGYGLGVDVGRRMGVGGMMVTPRAGVEWSKVELDDFVDMEPAGGRRARVSVEEADSVKGRVGVMMETEVGSGETWGRLFASLDVEREFSDETEVKVGGELLKTEVRPTALRLGLGGAFAVDEDVVVRATGGYRASGSGTSGYGGGLELQVRF